MPIDPTQQHQPADEFAAMADGDDTEGHLGAGASEVAGTEEGFRADFVDGGDDDDTEGHLRSL